MKPDENNPNKFFRYGRWWYKIKRDAYDVRKPSESIIYDSILEAYFIYKPIKWDF